MNDENKEMSQRTLSTHKMLELARTLVFFVMTWSTVHYVRGQILEPLDDFFKGAGKVVGVVVALGLAVFKLYAHRKAGNSRTFMGRVWRVSPWFIGVVLPIVILVFYFSKRTDPETLERVIDWLSLIVEFVIPTGALAVVYVLLRIERKLESSSNSTLEK